CSPDHPRDWDQAALVHCVLGPALAHAIGTLGQATNVLPAILELHCNVPTDLAIAHRQLVSHRVQQAFAEAGQTFVEDHTYVIQLVPGVEGLTGAYRQSCLTLGTGHGSAGTRCGLV